MDRHQEAPTGPFGSLWKSRAGLALIVFISTPSIAPIFSAPCPICCCWPAR